MSFLAETTDGEKVVIVQKTDDPQRGSFLTSQDGRTFKPAKYGTKVEEVFPDIAPKASASPSLLTVPYEGDQARADAEAAAAADKEAAAQAEAAELEAAAEAEEATRIARDADRVAQREQVNQDGQIDAA